jgi:hypothetical protein
MHLYRVLSPAGVELEITLGNEGTEKLLRSKYLSLYGYVDIYRKPVKKLTKPN